MIYNEIHELTEYAIKAGLIEECDRDYTVGRLLELLKLSDYSPSTLTAVRPLNEILDDITDYAVSAGLTEGEGIVARDLFDTKIMGAVTPAPREVIAKFNGLYEKSPEAATDYFYTLARNSNYIRTDRILRDLKWQTATEFGNIDITVNLSKPEKDPAAIAAAKLLPQSGYPKCLLCHENEGYAGTLLKPARQNLRQIPILMNGEAWFLQYSPYVYYNEHCIALSAEHKPMSISSSTFEKLLDFVTAFPHYFIGSNADLPIVGGSILSHDHMQGGRYTFAMERAPIEIPVSLLGYESVRAGIVKWPMSVIRISGTDKSQLVTLADKILTAWRSYTDEEAFIYAETNGTPHNTITPIARRRNGEYELDLVLRNNVTTEEHPMGVYHPHAEYHNIKKENIGLIEVMGLAVLPARLKDEMAKLEAAILAGDDIRRDEELAKHYEWLASFRDAHTFTKENTGSILREEIGKTFAKILGNAGVYKYTPKGKENFLKFIDFVNKY